jgi:hypothetical protein
MTPQNHLTTLEHFLRTYLTDTQKKSVDTTSDPDDFVITFDHAESNGDDIRVVFQVNIPMRFGDHRIPEHINGALRAMMQAHPELSSVAIQVTVNTVTD